jgi:ketosteroid isomerase-like protein
MAPTVDGDSTTVHEGESQMSPTSQEVEAAIRELDDDRMRAMIGGDADRVAELLSDDLVYMHTTGDRDTKESYLAKLRSGFVEYKYIERLEERVFVHGEVAYLTGWHIGLSILEGQPRLMDSYFLAIWKVVEGGWKLCAWQATAHLPAAR